MTFQHYFWVKLSYVLRNELIPGANLGGGCRGCEPPRPRSEMPCGFLIQLVFCQKKCGLLVLKQSKRRVHPLLKKILDPPLNTSLNLLSFLVV